MRNSILLTIVVSMALTACTASVLEEAPKVSQRAIIEEQIQESLAVFSLELPQEGETFEVTKIEWNDDIATATYSDSANEYTISIKAEMNGESVRLNPIY